MGCLVEKEGNLRGREWIETNADGMGGHDSGKLEKGRRRCRQKTTFRACECLVVCTLAAKTTNSIRCGAGRTGSDAIPGR